MGDASTPLTRDFARHLLRRTGFGATLRDLDKIEGLPRGEAVNDLLDFKPKSFKPGGRDIESVHNSWVKYMVRTSAALQEKLVLFWHDHFATSNVVVQDHEKMRLQNRRFRQNCKGNFKDLVKLVNKDAAMMEFLDTVRNRKAQPNENYARELQELFTLGVTDVTGVANYAQADIVQIARAFSGWRYDDNDREKPAFLNTNQHDFAVDFPSRGPKVIYTTVGQFGVGGSSFAVNGEGAAEIDTVIDIIFTHRDSNSKNTVARHLARKLITYFAHATPSQSFVDAVIATSSFDTTWNVEELLRAIFNHDEFYLTATPAGPGTKKSVKWPADFVVSTMRMLKMKFKGRDLAIARSGGYKAIRDQLIDMGQTLFEPPSVFGWDWEEGWISSQSMLERFKFARNVTGARDGGSSSFRPEKFMDLSLTDPGAIVDAATDLLGVKDEISITSRQKLMTYLGAGPIDLLDFDVRNTKLHGLFALLIQSPEYQLH